MRDNPRILIVRPSALGDVCRTVPCLVSLRHAYPLARIDWLVRREFAPAIQSHPMLSQALPFDRRGGTSNWLTLLRDLRQRRYDLVFDLQGLARSAVFTAATRSPLRYGPADARELGWLAYNRRVPLDPTRHVHAVDRMQAVVEAAGVKRIDDLRLYVPPEAQAWHRTTLGEGPYFVLAPTSRWESKNWPLDRFAEIARRLLDHCPDWRAVILASPEEMTRVRPLLDALPPERVCCPITSVAGMLAVISRAQLVIANDSAALHAAVGFDRPLAAIFGPTDPQRVGPYGRMSDVLSGVSPSEIRGLGTYRHARSHPDVQGWIQRVSVDQLWRHLQDRCLPPLAKSANKV